MTDIEFKQAFIDALKMRPGFRQNRSELVTKCPSCENGNQTDKPGHLYINYATKEGYPYSCKRCPLSGGNISVALLDSLGVHDHDMIKFVSDNFRHKMSHFVNVNEKIKRIDYKLPHLLKQDQFKIDKLNERLPRPILEQDDYNKYRIVTNITKFVKDNDIKVDTFTEKELSLFPMLDSSYLGMLSYFGNAISFRNMTENRDIPRYITMNVNKDLKRAFFYAPMMTINPLTEEPKITLAEGCIDIISIHMNDSPYDVNNNLYAATTSSGSYRSALKTALGLSGFYGAQLNLYLDNDDGVTSISSFDFDKIVRSLSGIGNSFKVIAIINTSSKDFGDVRKKITVAKRDITNLIK